MKKARLSPRQRQESFPHPGDSGFYPCRHELHHNTVFRSNSVFECFGRVVLFERRWLRHTRKRGEIPCVYSRALRGNDTMGFRPRCVSYNCDTHLPHLDWFSPTLRFFMIAAHTSLHALIWFDVTAGKNARHQRSKPS